MLGTMLGTMLGPMFARNDAQNDAQNDAWNKTKMQPSVKRQDSHFGKMSSSSPFPKLPTGTTSGHKVTRNSFRGQGLYFGLYFVDRGKKKCCNFLAAQASLPGFYMAG